MRSFVICRLSICLFIMALPAALTAQRSGSSYIFPRSDKTVNYNAVGLVGQSIHIWEIPTINRLTGSRKVLLKIHIFSQDMQLLTTRELSLDTVDINLIENIDFTIRGDEYLATVQYIAGANGHRKMQIRHFRIDEKGDGWNGRPDVSNAPIPVFATIARNNSESGEETGKDEKLHVRRIFLKDSSYITQEYGAGGYSFTWPRVVLSDNSLIWVVSLAHQSSKKAAYGVTSQALFMARLDSNLTDLTRPRLYAFQSRGAKAGYDYLPQYLLPSDSNLFIISKESDPYLTPVYAIPYGRYYYPYMPSRYGWYDYNMYGPAYSNPYSRQPLYIRKAPRSLRVTLANPSLSVMQDTIISADLHGSTLDVENVFLRRAENGIDLLIGETFAGTREGIRHYMIDSLGKLSDRALMVDARYHFMVDKATTLSSAVVLVPFSYRNRIGFLVQSW